jgi:hypothetical protein
VDQITLASFFSGAWPNCSRLTKIGSLECKKWRPTGNCPKGMVPSSYYDGNRNKVCHVSHSRSGETPGERDFFLFFLRERAKKREFPPPTRIPPVFPLYYQRISSRRAAIRHRGLALTRPCSLRRVGLAQQFEIRLQSRGIRETDVAQRIQPKAGRCADQQAHRPRRLLGTAEPRATQRQYTIG